jgi:hypothetical protein
MASFPTEGIYHLTPPTLFFQQAMESFMAISFG